MRATISSLGSRPRCRRGAALSIVLLGNAWACAHAGGGEPRAAAGSEAAERRAEPRLCDSLPPRAAERLEQALASSRGHGRHVWRDLPPFNPDGTLNAFVEIPLGERRKWEFDLASNQLRLDRTLDESVGGYPINYGFVPQTISCDGDPFDVLVLGPPVASGTVVRATIVGVMYMDDEKGADPKVIVTPSPDPGAGADPPGPERRAELQRWFDGYKKADAEQGRWSAVSGFGSAEEGRQLVLSTHEFYREGVARSGQGQGASDASVPP